VQRADFGAALTAEQDLADREANRAANAREALPDESKCSICGYFDTEHPDVRRILLARDATERLLEIAQCKCVAQAREKQAADQRRWGQANLPSDVPGGRELGSFRVEPDTEEMFRAVEAFTAGRGPHILVLVGAHGCGKSHLIESALRAMLERGLRCRYEVGKRYLDRLRHTFQGGETEDLAELAGWYQDLGVLGLDDIGMEKATDFAASELTDLVDKRMQYGRPTILATNKTKDEMAEHLGDRLASRMYATNPELGTVKLVISGAPDYRQRRRW